MIKSLRKSCYIRTRQKLLGGDVYDKVQSSQSVIDSRVVTRVLELERQKENHPVLSYYFRDLLNLLENVNLTLGRKPLVRCLDVGCAMGNVSAFMARNQPHWNFTSIDLMPDLIVAAKSQHKLANLNFICGDFFNIELTNFNIVISLQTCEHIEDEKLNPFLAALFDKAGHAVVLSVPREPIWCFSNLMRGKYWRRLGNSPHHVQHWTKSGFIDLVELQAMKSWGSYEMKVLSPLSLWTLILVKKN